ncbi:nickel/cobalt efflux transporter [Roseicella sp. DB1501]|uniref:nickel/cobalt efflux transporter n=1 Tax=Roseicella sp. DB1501 TaxID=2730925 RepID=UPI001491E0B1|nr:nickel/cobalt efflux transporter [Roseicella sp. DB1501]NOG73369.1 nickel/cobalt efflux transporter RcnA [Roseicella sp. DB1501]
MTPLSELLQQGTAQAWLFIPSAILLGALHGLEPGHSKTMMAAFIIAVRGTVTHAVLLGLAATISHTAVVWAVALVGLHLGGQFDAETTEPYFQVASAVLIIGVALWMIWRTWREGRQTGLAEHDHHHGEEVRRIDTDHGVLALEVFEEDVPPRWRVRFESGHGWKAEEVTITTERPNGTRQAFAFADRGAYLESLEEIPEPHAFTAHICLAQGSATRTYDIAFAEHDHGHHHEGLDVSGGEYEDAHQRAHANDIRQRFANRHVTTGQIIMFGLTGGLIPCPAAITVLLLCLQLKEFTLGVALVLCFSIGLALTMVTAGVAAALSIRHVSQRWSGFGTFAQRAPYFSSAVIICVGLYVGYQGLHGLAAAVRF